MKSYLKPLPSELPRLLYWTAGITVAVMVTVAVGLLWAGAR
jgi:hypothetical protein